MKKSLVLLLLASSLFLGACGNRGATPDTGISISVSGPTSVEVGKTIKLNITVTNDIERLGVKITSSNPDVASVNDDGRVTGRKVGNAIITVTYDNDDSIKATYEIEVVESSLPTLSIGGDRDFIVLGSGSLTFTANLHNPTNFVPSYLWESQNGVLSPIGARNETAVFRPIDAGTDFVKLTVRVGPYCLVEQKSVLVQPDFEDGTWASIQSAEDFKTKLLANGTITGNYALDADIDLDGMEIGANTRDFAGVLEGKGHTISNFTVTGTAEGVAYTNGGMWHHISGSIRDTGFVGEIPEWGSGWGGGLLSNTCNGHLENIFVDVNHSFDNGEKQVDGYVQFNAALAGVIQEGADWHDLVINVKDNAGKSTIYADTAYPAGFGKAQTFHIGNLYTNTAVAGGQTWDWGGPVSDMSSYYTNITFASKPASFYELNARLWNLSDNQMPTLKVRD